jgi:hypothetical protein
MSHFGDGRLFLRQQGHVPRHSAPGAEKAGGYLFQHKVFKMLLNKGKITKEMIAMLSTWRHFGFHVSCGNRISPDDETGYGEPGPLYRDCVAIVL